MKKVTKLIAFATLCASMATAFAQPPNGFGPGRGFGGRGGFGRGFGEMFGRSPSGPHIPREDLEFKDGVAGIPDHETFHKVPPRNLAVKQICPLAKVGFSDADSVGVKAANLAVMRTFDLPGDVVPDGYAVPFYFNDEFMKYNGFYNYLEKLLKNPMFLADRDTQEAELKNFRSLIKKGKMPEWMLASLAELHNRYPKGQSLRCRSSTNNEDLPGFSGAGLYDSFTHKSDEGHISKSIKQVYASMWNFRAFEEREFYRVDHFASAMGVLVHPNYKGELASGVTVTDDIFYQTYGNYYVSTQVGEDLVTNPGDDSVPEELLLGWYERDGHQIMQRSSETTGDKLLLTGAQMAQLRTCLTKIHAKFAKAYGRSLEDERFAMEIEFKITKAGTLVIKQARPWVYNSPSVAEEGDERKNR